MNELDYLFQAITQIFCIGRIESQRNFYSTLNENFFGKHFNGGNLSPIYFSLISFFIICKKDWESMPT